MPTATTPRAHKIRAGLYQVTIGDRTYQIEDRFDISPDRPMWRLSDETGTGEWIADYGTKREALDALVTA